MAIATEQGEFFFNVRQAMAAGAYLDNAAELADAEMYESELCSNCGAWMRLSYSLGRWSCPECGEERAF